MDLDPAELARIRRQLLDQPGPIADDPGALDNELARLDAGAYAARRQAREAGAERPADDEAHYHRRRAWVLARLARHRGGRWELLADDAVSSWHQAEAAAGAEAVSNQLAAEAAHWLSTRPAAD
ncbi:hypothetical protein [Streptomyces gilvosporeus]|uniref:hypothetical protein n=1 Tax=Streptomyces gilvosporeus TaxID=553510 RepID=UPI003401F8F7